MRVVSFDHLGLLNPLWLPPEDQSWVDFGACVGAERDLWFSTVPADIQSAREVCAQCPVADECLDHSLHEPVARHGVWGGLTWEERNVVRNAPERWVKCRNCGTYFWRSQRGKRLDRCDQC